MDLEMYRDIFSKLSLSVVAAYFQKDKRGQRSKKKTSTGSSPNQDDEKLEMLQKLLEEGLMYLVFIILLVVKLGIKGYEKVETSIINFLYIYILNRVSGRDTQMANLPIFPHIFLWSVLHVVLHFQLNILLCPSI